MPKGRGPSQQPRIEARDYELLRGLFECRVMTQTHATALYFDGRYDAACKRLQSLKAAGYVGDRRERVGSPSVLHLTKKSFDLLAGEGRLSDFPKLAAEQFSKRSRIKASTLAHELSVMDVRVAITSAIRAAGTHRSD